MDRKLAAIVAVDIAGFSALVEVDEEGTLAARRDLRTSLIDPLLAKYSGRVANTAGDSLLIEFPSAVEAVRCAQVLQTAMAKRNAGVPSDRRILYRIGVNSGDVVVEDGDLLGDSVNISARLEALAPPGGIVLSRAVRDQIRDKLELDLSDLGEIQVKNIARPVRAFQVLTEGQGEIQTVTRPKNRWPRLAGAAVLLATALSAALIWMTQSTDIVPADPHKMAYALDDQPSIAVLAFENLTGDPEQEHVSDGLSEDIISSLARLPGVLVIARNSSFVYKSEPTDIRKIAEDLSVRFVLAGSLQQSDDTLRISAQLVDALTGHLVWSGKYDRPRAEFFAVRDEIIQQIIAELNRNVVDSDTIGGRIETFGSMDLWFVGRKASWHARRWTPADIRIAIDLANQVLAKEPDSVWAHGTLAIYHGSVLRLGWSDDPQKTLGLAEAHAERAIDLDEQSPGGHLGLSWVRIAQNRVGEAITLGEKALDRAPGDSIVLGVLALYYQKDMQADRAIELFERAIRVDRKAPAWVWENYGEALVMAGRHAAAVPVYLESLKTAKGFMASDSHLGLAIAYDALGRSDDAKTAIAAAIRNAPEITVSYMRDFQRYKDQDYKDRWLATLQRLGVPEY